MPKLKITRQEIQLIRQRIWCMSEIKDDALKSYYHESPRHSFERLSNQIISNALGEITNRRNNNICNFAEPNQTVSNPYTLLSGTSMDKIITAKYCLSIDNFKINKKSKN